MFTLVPYKFNKKYVMKFKKTNGTILGTQIK